MSNRYRWFVAAAAILIQLCLGAAYGWSVFVKPLVKVEHWSLPAVSLTFSLAIFCLGIGTAIGGTWQDRVGPRVVCSVAGVLYGLGYFVAAAAVRNHTLPGVYLGYGVISGLGMGMGYVCPIATLVKWFPERRGLMSGIAVCGYGMGALVMSAVAAPRIATVGVSSTFMQLGAAYLVLVVVGAQFLRNPTQTAAMEAAQARSGAVEFTTRQALGSQQFWVLWLMLFFNVSAGIMIISQASPMAQQLAGATPVAAAGVVGVIAIFNGLGRVVWAAASDYIGRTRVFMLLFLLQACVFFALPHCQSLGLFTVVVGLVGFAYGGGFGTMPSLTADLFGSRSMGGIYGCILLAWGCGAVPSPMLIAYVREHTGGYSAAIYGIAVVMVAAIALPLLVKPGANRSVDNVTPVSSQMVMLQAHVFNSPKVFRDGSSS